MARPSLPLARVRNHLNRPLMSKQPPPSRTSICDLALLAQAKTRAIGIAPLVAATVLVAACGSVYRQPAGPPTGRPQHVALSPWPGAADYRTITIALAVRDDALFHQRDWRRKAFAASLAARTLLTVRIAAGTCAGYVTELYGNLRDLMDAYPREDWRPLVRLVRHEPSLQRACKPPTTRSERARAG
jgi:hypothetical protein